MTQTSPPVRRPPFRTLAILALIALLAALLLYLQLRAAQDRAAELSRLAAEQRTLNGRLETEIARLQNALRDDPCKAKEHLAAPPLAVPPSPAVEPESPVAAPQAPPAGPPAAQKENSSTPGSAELPEQATVLVLAQNSKGVGMGSGFFVTPDTVFTNSHVVMEKNSAVVAGNKSTGGLLPGRVVAFDNAGGRDYALIRLEKSVGRPLALKSGARRTDRVNAWGFPGAVTGGDPKFLAMLRCNTDITPEVVFTEGAISVVLERRPPLIVHSAVASQGSSGGPLTDTQGNVIGINTFIRLDDESYRQSSLALPAADIITFLREQGIAFTQAEDVPGNIPPAASPARNEPATESPGGKR